MKQKVISFGAPRKTTAPGRAAAKAAGNRRKKRRRTGRQTLNYVLILLVAAAVITILSLTVLFKIERIEVTGTTKYAAEELIEASGVKTGDNLFRVNEHAVSKKLAEKYAYIERVKLKRTLPPKLTLEITQAKPLGAADTPGGYVVIARSGRVLEIGAQTLPEGITVVTGMYLYSPKERQVLGTGYTKDEQAEADKETASFKMLIELVDAVALTEFDKITLVDFSDGLNIMIVYDNRIMIELGSRTKLDYKLRLVKKGIEENLSSNFEGIIDASFAGTAREAFCRPADVQAELEKRRLNVAAQAALEQSRKEAGENGVPPVVNNPELATVPGTASSVPQSASSGAGSAAGSGAPAEAPSSEAVSSLDELATIPNSAEPAAENTGQSTA